jgi:hypothetical protein
MARSFSAAASVPDDDTEALTPMVCAWAVWIPKVKGTLWPDGRSAETAQSYAVVDPALGEQLAAMNVGGSVVTADDSPVASR